MPAPEEMRNASRVDCAIIGAGAIGLCIARRLALRGAEVVVLEEQGAIGTQISSRNSEVIHAGLYYPAGSLKARLCVEGKSALYDYCESHRVRHRRCGKLVLATSESQVDALASLKLGAEANGVLDLEWLAPEQVRQLEPAVFCTAAIWSPSSGIMDVHGLMLCFQADAEAAGATIVHRAPVLGGRIEDECIELSVGGDHAMNLAAAWVVNAAGLSAHKVAASLRGLDSRFIPNVYYAKGNYFSLTGKAPFRRPIYPLPEKGGLGIHATIDLAGQVRFGPDVEWVNEIRYQVDSRRSDHFYTAVRKYFPELADGSLQPAFSGIRPKLAAQGAAEADFLIQDGSVHGVAGLVNLFGIESPGLTASLAIADRVAEMLHR